MNKDPYGTHQPFLKHYIQKTKGDIVEFGTGDNSTGLILDLIKGTNRKLVSLENDRYWQSRIVQKYPPSPNHQHIFVPSGQDPVQDWKKTLSTLDKNAFELVFIDQSPWEARIWTMDYFKDSADYIIIHDVDYFPKNGLFGKINIKCLTEDPEFDFSDKFQKWHVYYPEKPYPYITGPPTLVGTNKDAEIDLVIN